MIDPETLHSHLQTLLPEALDRLRQMVAVNSFTHNADGIDRVGALTAECFAPLGFVAERPQAMLCSATEQAPLGRHLLLHRLNATGPRIAMVGHLDTVFTPEIEAENDFKWRAIGDRIYGPGVVDIKGGNVLIWMVLDALRALLPDVFKAVDWRVILNAAEEGLASDFGSVLCRTLGTDSLACLVFEGGELVGNTHRVITRRKGSIGLRAIATGRAAHSGTSHVNGANAIAQLCDAVARLDRLTDYDRDLTCNVGIIRGGAVVNQVPDYAEALLELRAFDPGVLKEAMREVEKIDGLSSVRAASDGFEARVRIECRTQHAPWPANAGSESLAAVWKDAGARMGLQVETNSRGGLSDGNFAHHLAPTLDGLGPVGGNLHCASRINGEAIHQEYVLPHTLVTRAALNVLAIEQLVASHQRRGSHTP